MSFLPTSFVVLLGHARRHSLPLAHLDCGISVPALGTVSQSPSCPPRSWDLGPSVRHVSRLSTSIMGSWSQHGLPLAHLDRDISGPALGSLSFVYLDHGISVPALGTVSLVPTSMAYSLPLAHIDGIVFLLPNSIVGSRSQPIPLRRRRH